MNIYCQVFGLHSADVYKVGVWKEIDSMKVHPDHKDAHENLKILIMKANLCNTLKCYELYVESFCKWRRSNIRLSLRHEGGYLCEVI